MDEEKKYVRSPITFGNPVPISPITFQSKGYVVKPISFVDRSKAISPISFVDKVNIPLRRSRLSGKMETTCPDRRKPL